MRSRILTVFFAAVTVAMLLATPALAKKRECGDVTRKGHTAYTITTSGTCPHARQVVAQFVRETHAGGAARFQHSGRSHRCSWKSRACLYYAGGKTLRVVRWKWTVPFNTSTASVYDAVGLGGVLGCTGPGYSGGYMLVAHKTLPCGTRVEVCYRGCVTAIVNDRGPYVGGREFDLDVRVQRAIGFPYGVGGIRWRVL